MSSLTLFTVIVCALVTISKANIGQRFIGHAISEDYPGQCYYKDEKVPIKIGSSHLSKKECVEIECQEEFVLRFQECPAYGHVGPECTRIQDKNALYPKCCLTFKCPQ